MHGWAQRHRELLEEGLDEDESLIDANRTLLVSVGKVDLVGGSRGSAVPGARHRRGQRGLVAARSHNVDLPARFFVLAVTDRRLVVWRATRALARPVEVATTIPVETVISLRAGRRFGPSRLHVVLADGTHLQLRPLGRGRLDHLADAYATARRSPTAASGVTERRRER